MCLAAVIKYSMLGILLPPVIKKKKKNYTKNKRKLTHLKIPRLPMSNLSSPGKFSQALVQLRFATIRYLLL